MSSADERPATKASARLRWRARAIQGLLGARRAALRGLAPAASIVAPVLFLHLALVCLHFSAARFHPWIGLLLLPPVALEIAFTRWFEVRRYGWHVTVVLGLVARLAFIGGCYYLLIWRYMQYKYEVDIIVAGLVDWPLVGRMLWQASPLLAGLLAIPLLVAHGVLTCRYRLFRLTTVVLLPTLATVLLFRVLYFHPASGWRGIGGQRPSDVQKVFPPPGPPRVPRLTTPLFARSIYVAPDDGWIALTAGATFGSRDLRHRRPNFLWMDLKTKRTAYELIGPVRIMTSSCDRTLYYAPWHGHQLHAFDTRTQRFATYPLPGAVNGHRVNEINAVYHDCRAARVYIANAQPPVLFVWDTRGKRVVRTLDLSRLAGFRPSMSPGRIQRSPRDGRLVMLLHGIYQVLELGTHPVAPRRLSRLPVSAFDLAYTPHGAFAYAPSFFRGEIWKLNADTLAPVARLEAPPQCRRLAVSSDGALLYVTSYLHGRLHVYELAKGREAFSIYVSPKLEGLFQTRRYLYLYGAEGVFRVRHEDLRRRL